MICLVYQHLTLTAHRAFIAIADPTFKNAMRPVSLYIKFNLMEA